MTVDIMGIFFHLYYRHYFLSKTTKFSKWLSHSFRGTHHYINLTENFFRIVNNDQHSYLANHHHHHNVYICSILQTQAGEGRVYKCLFNHKFEESMSEKVSITFSNPLKQYSFKLITKC